MCINTSRENTKKMESGSFQWCAAPGQEAMDTQEIPSKHQETLLYCAHDRALRQVSSELVESPFCEDLQKLSRNGPWQHALDVPA